MKDYYKILGVEENASDDEIKKQYRVLSKKYHPDINPEGAETFKEIAEAYENIGNSNKRAEYDNKRKNPFGGDFDSLFSNIFNGGNPFGGNPFGGGRQQRKSAPDKIIKVEISPIESYLANEKTITYLRNNPCERCNGGGGDQETCNTCKGSGRQVKTFGTGFMVQQVVTGCDSCGGKGYTLKHKCYLCDGRGTKTETNEVKFKLPHGIDDGQFLKLESLGDFVNGQHGDLVLQIQMTKNEFWEKFNNDLIYNLTLGYDDLKKEKYLVPHPDGEINISAPLKFDTSRPLRVRGKGYGGGDMYVKLHVKFDRELL